MLLLLSSSLLILTSFGSRLSKQPDSMSGKYENTKDEILHGEIHKTFIFKLIKAVLSPNTAEFVKWTCLTLNLDQSIEDFWDIRIKTFNWPVCAGWPGS